MTVLFIEIIYIGQFPIQLFPILLPDCARNIGVRVQHGHASLTQDLLQLCLQGLVGTAQTIHHLPHTTIDSSWAAGVNGTWAAHLK